MPASRRAVLIVNAHARRGREWFGEVRSKLSRAGVQLDSEVLVGPRGDLGQELDQAVQSGAEVILVGGGDGTLNIAARRLAGTQRIMGVLPLGTGNAFARDLGIRTDIGHAVETIVQGDIREVDIGRANETVFLNLASLGLTTLVARFLRKGPKAAWGPLAYATPLLQALRVIRPFDAQLSFIDGTAEVTAYQIVVGNGRFHAGPFVLGPGAAIDSGEFLIYAVEAGSKGVLLKYMVSVMLGSQTEIPEIQVWRRQQVKIETAPKRRIVLDGELAETTPCSFIVVPRGLRVLVPGQMPPQNQP